MFISLSNSLFFNLQTDITYASVHISAINEVETVETKICGICSYQTTISTNINRHMKMHSGKSSTRVKNTLHTVIGVWFTLAHKKINMNRNLNIHLLCATKVSTRQHNTDSTAQII